MKKVFAVLIVGCVFSACAYNKSPVVDYSYSDVSQQQYAEDYAYCESFASKVNTGEVVAVSAANHAVAVGGWGVFNGALDHGTEGAVVLGLLGGIFGGIYGGIEGAISATDIQARVLRNCLYDKGYAVYDRY